MTQEQVVVFAIVIDTLVALAVLFGGLMAYLVKLIVDAIVRLALWSPGRSSRRLTS